MELEAGGNYRKTYVDQANYSESESLTGSLAYYFWNSSALELSYTKGRSLYATPTYDALADFELYGLDFILTFAGRESRFQPYIKLGGAYQKKKIMTMVQNTDPVSKQVEGPSPSAGIGFKLMLTESLGVKIGAEAWTSPMTKDNQPVTYDIAGRAGVSWMF